MRCPRCAADILPLAEICAACGAPIERTHPIALPLVETKPAPSAPRSSRPSGPSAPTAKLKAEPISPLPSPAPLFDEPPAAGSQTVNDRPKVEPAATDRTHPSLEAIEAVPERPREANTDAVPALLRPGLTTDRVAAVPKPELAVEPTALAAPLVPTDSTRLTLEPVAVSSSETQLKLPEVSEPHRPAWALVLLGSLATAALIIGVVALFIPADEPAVAVVEEIAIEPQPQKPAEEKTEEKKDDGPVKEAPKASWGDPVARKAAFYPDEPTDNAKRGVAPSHAAPPKGVLRVVTVAHGNLVSAPISLDHQPQGLTPKEFHGLKPGVHLFEVVVGEGPPMQVRFPILAATKQKTGDYLEIEIAQDGEVVQRTPAPTIGRSGRSSDGVVPQRRGK